MWVNPGTVGYGNPRSDCRLHAGEDLEPEVLFIAQRTERDAEGRGRRSMGCDGDTAAVEVPDGPSVGEDGDDLAPGDRGLTEPALSP